MRFDSLVFFTLFYGDYPPVNINYFLGSYRGSNYIDGVWGWNKHINLENQFYIWVTTTPPPTAPPTTQSPGVTTTTAHVTITNGPTTAAPTAPSTTPYTGTTLPPKPTPTSATTVTKSTTTKCVPTTSAVTVVTSVPPTKPAGYTQISKNAFNISTSGSASF